MLYFIISVFSFQLATMVTSKHLAFLLIISIMVAQMELAAGRHNRRKHRKRNNRKKFDSKELRNILDNRMSKHTSTLIKTNRVERMCSIKYEPKILRLHLCKPKEIKLPYCSGKCLSVVLQQDSMDLCKACLPTNVKKTRHVLDCDANAPLKYVIVTEILKCDCRVVHCEAPWIYVNKRKILIHKGCSWLSMVIYSGLCDGFLVVTTTKSWQEF